MQNYSIFCLRYFKFCAKIFTMNYRDYIAEKLNVEGVGAEEISSCIVVPPDTSMGDYALPCFKFAKVMRKSPAVIAADLAASFKCDEVITSVQAVNGYLNFKVNRARAKNSGRRTPRAIRLRSMRRSTNRTRQTTSRGGFSRSPRGRISRISQFCIARTHSRTRSNMPSSATAFRTGSSAARAFLTAPRSRTCWRTCA